MLEGDDRMKHLKITGIDGIDEARIAAFVQVAVQLNRTQGDPTKRAAR